MESGKIFVNKPRIAIILIPGIGGSNLISYKNNKITPNEGFGADLPSSTAWHLGANTAEGARKMLLDAKEDWRPIPLEMDKPKTLNDLEWKKGWGQVASSLYHPFLRDCQNKKSLPFIPEVFAIGYNFINSNEFSGKDIIQRTQQIMEDKSFAGYIYITHSMGALPVRYALKFLHQLGDPLFAKCKGVIHVAAPLLGAPELLRRFIQGVASESKSPIDKFTAYLLGNNGKAFTQQSCVMQSMFELLPPPSLWSKLFVHEMGPYKPQFPDLMTIIENLFKDNSSECQEIMKIAAPNLKAAQVFLEDLGDYLHPKTSLLILKGDKKTTAGLKYNGFINLKLDPIKSFEVITGDGDGTVTAQSQGEESNCSFKCKINNVAHVNPFNEIGEKNLTFTSIYTLLENLYLNIPTNTGDLSKIKSVLSSYFNSGVNYALSSESIVLNGMKVIFDQSVPVYPVNLKRKDEVHCGR
jgi:hypothetical protein